MATLRSITLPFCAYVSVRSNEQFGQMRSGRIARTCDGEASRTLTSPSNAAVPAGYCFGDDGEVTVMEPSMMPALILSSSPCRFGSTFDAKSWNGARPTPSFFSVPT